MIKKFLACVAVLGLCGFAVVQAAAQEAKPLISYQADAEAASTELYGPESESTTAAEEGQDAYTETLAIDNRGSSGLPKPNPKRRVQVEVYTDDGDHFHYGEPQRFFVPAGLYDAGNFAAHKERVVKCRYAWKDRVFGKWIYSPWVTAKKGHYIETATIKWFGFNEYVTPISFKQKAIPSAN